MEGAGPHFHVVGLGDHAAKTLSPVLLQLENQFLKRVRSLAAGGHGEGEERGPGDRGREYSQSWSA